MIFSAIVLNMFLTSNSSLLVFFILHFMYLEKNQNFVYGIWKYKVFSTIKTTLRWKELNKSGIQNYPEIVWSHEAA